MFERMTKSCFETKNALFYVQIGYICRQKQEKMKDGEYYSALDLMMLPLDERACIFNDEFILADNLEASGEVMDLLADETVSPFMTSPYPFKIRFTMMLFCLGGRMRVQHNLSEYLLQKNDVLLILSGTIGQCLEISSDCKIAIIAFLHQNLVPEINSQVAVVVRKFLMERALLHLADNDMEELFLLYRMLQRRIEQSDYAYKRELITSCMQMMSFHFFNWMKPYVDQQEKARVGNRKRQIYDDFMQLLQSNYTSERSVGFYAGKLCITPKYLSQVVYAVSGRYAGDWIRDYVILEAKALLKSGRYNVQQVSNMLNFPNQSFFGVYFKKETGYSPRAYQETK